MFRVQGSRFRGPHALVQHAGVFCICRLYIQLCTCMQCAHVSFCCREVFVSGLTVFEARHRLRVTAMIGCASSALKYGDKTLKAAAKALVSRLRPWLIRGAVRTESGKSPANPGDHMNPKRVYGSYTLQGIIVVQGIRWINSMTQFFGFTRSPGNTLWLGALHRNEHLPIVLCDVLQGADAKMVPAGPLVSR